MPQFTFIARTEEGKRKEGSIEASNINKASEKLTNRNLVVIKLTEKDLSFDFMGPFLDRLSLKLEKLKTRIPLKTLVFFTRQLATMFAAGLTIEKSFFFFLWGITIARSTPDMVAWIPDSWVKCQSKIPIIK